MFKVHAPSAKATLGMSAWTVGRTQVQMDDIHWIYSSAASFLLTEYVQIYWAGEEGGQCLGPRSIRCFSQRTSFDFLCEWPLQTNQCWQQHPFAQFLMHFKPFGNSNFPADLANVPVRVNSAVSLIWTERIPEVVELLHWASAALFDCHSSSPNYLLPCKPGSLGRTIACTRYCQARHSQRAQ